MNQTVENSVRSVLDEALTNPSSDVILVNPWESMVSALPALVEGTDGPTFKVLADESVLKALRRDFTVAVRLADHIADDRLALRTYNTTNRGLVVTSSSMTSVINVDGRAAGIQCTDESVIDSVYEACMENWTAGSEFPLRTPPLSEVHESLASEFQQAVVADLETVLESVDVGSGPDRLHPASVCLLVAARHDVTLHDVSTWGEDIGIASKATFSRYKTTLEELGIVATEKVPVDIGRPRQRLHLAADPLQHADADEFPEQAWSLVQDG